MYEKLNELFCNFYGEIDLSESKTDTDNLKEKFVQNISKEDKKVFEELLNEMRRIHNCKIKDSFIQGFKLGTEITKELNEYNYEVIEKEIRQ